MIFTNAIDAASYCSHLRENGKSIVTVSGGFDPFHIGHLRYLQAAAKLADSLIVIANGDGFLSRKKGKAFIPLNERMEILGALRCVDVVVAWDDGTQTVVGALEALKPDIFANGGDRSDSRDVPEVPICEAIGCKLAFGVGGEEKLQSSSALLAGLETAITITKKA